MTRWTEKALKKARTPPGSALTTAKQYHAQAGKKKPLKMPESTANQITAAAILWLNLNGFKAWRNNSNGVWDPVKKVFRKNKAILKGVSDVCGFCKTTGRALFIEVKAGRDKLSPEQTVFLEEAEKAGCITGVIRDSREIETIIQLYKQKT